MSIPSNKKAVILGAVSLLVLAILVYVIYLMSQDKQTDIDGNTIIVDERPIPNFAEYTDVVEKKKAFFSYLLPEIRQQNERIAKEREFLLGVDRQIVNGQDVSAEDIEKLQALASQYRVDEETPLAGLVSTLIKRVDIIPEELVLMQAANESAWGTSRFAQQGYNFFGLWCFRKGCGFVPRSRDDDAAHEVAKFRNLTHAVNTYLLTLNRHNAYKELRTIRLELRQSDKQVTAEALAQGLIRYSERGHEYIDELLDMLRFNRKFMQV